MHKLKHVNDTFKVLQFFSPWWLHSSQYLTTNLTFKICYKAPVKQWKNSQPQHL